MSDRDSYDQYLLREPMTALASGQFNMSSDGKETITPIISSSSAGFVTPENPTGDAKVTTPNTVSSRTPSGSIDLGKTTLGTLSIYDYIESDDFVTGSTGWRISGNGDAEFSNATIRGSLSAVTIDIGGADATSFHVDIDGNMWSGAATLAAAPFQVSSSGAMTATSGTFSGTITSTSGTIGGFSIGSDYIRDAADSMGMASTVTGSDDVRFWAGDTYANRATADFRVTEAGAVTASSITITGGSVEGTTVVLIGTLNIAARGWTQTSVFSVTDADTVAWGAGTFTSADGTSYAIDAGNTGNMTVATYIYLDIAVSTTAYQTTTTAATAVGAGKVLITKAQNGTGEATFQVFGGIGGQNIDAANIVTGSITTNEIAASTITGGNISSLSISGKTALFDTGTVGGWTMGANSLLAGSGATTVGFDTTSTGGDDIRIYAGSLTASSAPFRVTESGALTASSATITGILTASTGSVIDGLYVTETYTAGEDLTAGNAVTKKGIIINQEQAVNNSSQDSSIGGVDVTAVAQSFQVSSAISPDFIALRVTKVGTPTGSLFIDIYSDSAGSPNTLLGTSDTVATSSYVSGEWMIFFFSTPVALSTSTTYWIVADKNAGTVFYDSVLNYFALLGDTNNSYASGSAKAKAGTWQACETVLDFSFIIGNRANAVDTVYKSDARFAETTHTFIGFASETKSAAASVKIRTFGTETNQSSLTTGSIYYLRGSITDASSDCRGKIIVEETSGVGNANYQFAKRIGVATNTTKILLSPDSTPVNQ